MSLLFGKRKNPQSKTSSSSTKNSTQIVSTTSFNSNSDDTKIAVSFEDLGIDEWLSKKCSSLGIRKPTDVQRHCIPSILRGLDVIGCAQTGSGKTAAFALPILHKLSLDPYGPFALVLTPTRELAFQIDDQFRAFGSAIGVRTSVIVGGMDMLPQTLELKKCPHIIIATPGRLRDHLMGANPPNMSMLAFLVLDEADRLLETTYFKDLKYILNQLPSKASYQRLFFSATMTKDLQWLEENPSSMFRQKPFRYDAQESISTVENLKEYYVFFPFQIKFPTFLHILEQCQLIPSGSNSNSVSNNENDESDHDMDNNNTIQYQKKSKIQMVIPILNTTIKSMIVFVATCKMAQLLVEFLREFQIHAVPLHSMMSQKRRMASLGKFKSGLSNILICTDVASRGLDIPQVDLVFNFDLPRASADYIHRVGRTARAGRSGMALSFVSQYDIELLQSIEESNSNKKMVLLEDVQENNILKRLKDATTAIRVSKLRLIDYGFEEKLEKRKLRRQFQREKDEKYIKKKKKLDK